LGQKLTKERRIGVKRGQGGKIKQKKDAFLEQGTGGQNYKKLTV
jgi:hypothetical protein